MLETISDTGRGTGFGVENEKDKDIPSVSVLSSMETLLATMCADVNEWAAGWCKVLVFVKSQKRAPKQLSELDLEVPQHLRYMLTAEHSGGVKDETVGGSPLKDASVGSGGPDPSSSRSQSMQLGWLHQGPGTNQTIPSTATNTTRIQIRTF